MTWGIRGPEVRRNTTVKTGSGNVTVGNEAAVVINKTSGAATTVTLPVPVLGQTVWVKDGKGDAHTNRITVVPDGVTVTTIDGVARHIIAEDYGQRGFIYNGTQWNAFVGAPSDFGVVATTAGLTVCEMGDGAFHRTVFIFDAYSLATTDNGTAGAGGGAKIYDFPQGHVAILGVSQDWTLVTVDGTGLTNTAALEIGVGTTVATSAMASLTGTAEDLIAGLTFTLSSSLSAVNQFGSSVSAGQNVDGSTTAKDAYLNLTCSVATSTANGTAVLTGVVTLLWANAGLKL